tara:strand:+ start:633 stop:827 length:195 start_codon:yes stop_codon:yes gene_type:complete
MPEVNGQNFPYTKEGIEQAERTAKGTGTKVKYRFRRVMSSAVKSTQDKSKSHYCGCEAMGGWSF